MYLKNAAFLLLSFCCFNLLAQKRVSFIVDQMPAYVNQHSPVYLTGSFNNWNPKDKNYLLSAINNKIGITIDLAAGMFEYKFTRGSWKEGEATESGKPVPNRKMTIS